MLWPHVHVAVEQMTTSPARALDEQLGLELHVAGSMHAGLRARRPPPPTAPLAASWPRRPAAAILLAFTRYIAREPCCAPFSTIVCEEDEVAAPWRRGARTGRLRLGPRERRARRAARYSCSETLSLTILIRARGRRWRRVAALARDGDDLAAPCVVPVVALGEAARLDVGHVREHHEHREEREGDHALPHDVGARRLHAADGCRAATGTQRWRRRPSSRTRPSA